MCRLSWDHLLRCVGTKTVLEIFGIPETDFEIFRSGSLVTIFFENGIGFYNFLSESVWCFTHHFLRLPIFQKLPNLCLGNFSELCLGIFFRNFPACDFFASSVRLWIRITYFLFFGRFKISFGIDGLERRLRLTIWSFERIHPFLCTCYVLVIHNDRESTICFFSH
jgi:hypothetical protein